MKESKNVKNKKTRIIKYSVLTVLLTCFFVTGYFLISNGVIFGKLTVKTNTYVKGDVSTIASDQIDVTDQKADGAVPLTSDNDDLPSIPEFQGAKGTKTNPYVVLEVVPDLSQQSMSYLSGSQEDGLPFDPVVLGLKLCQDTSLGINSFLDQNDKTKLKSTSDINSKLNNFHYTFFGNNYSNSGFTTAFVDKDTGQLVKMNYFDTDWLYSLSLYSSDISEDDFKTKTVQQMLTANAESFATAYPEMFGVTKDADGNIKSVEVLDISLLHALTDENNWSKQIEENKDVNKSYSLTVSASDISDSDFKNLTMEQLAATYPTVFAKDSNGRDIAAADLAKDSKWVKKSSELTSLLSSGYLVKTAPGKGDYTITNGGLCKWSSNLELKKTGTDTDMWKYVESDTLPSDTSLNYDNIYQEWDRGNHFKEDGNIGSFIPLYTDSSNYNVNWHAALVTQNIYTFDFAKYKYTLKYAGMRFNDVLKYSIFERDTKEAYDKLEVKVITVTPDMINEMDSKDTSNTVDYIERADCFYISQYFSGFEAGAEHTSYFTNFYNKYCGGTGPIISDGSYDGLESFDHNDLEWFDCMKIIKRVSTNANLPLVWTKLVGAMEQEGVDGSYNSDLYIDTNHPSVEVKSAITNISKLFNITVQFDLLDHKSEEENKISYGSAGYRRTFMDDIFPYISCMKLNSDQQCSSSLNAPEYTGYYERSVLAIPGKSEDYNQRAYYLWNKFTFLPTDITGIFGSNGPYDVLWEKFGYLKSYFYENAMQNAYDSRGAAHSGGTDGTDEKNVHVVGEPGMDSNVNQSYPQNSGVTDFTHWVILQINNNGDKTPENLQLNLLKYPKYYTKMTNDTLLLDYSSKAKYRDEDKTVYIRFDLRNVNNEDAIVNKLSLVGEETADDGIILELQNDKNEVVSKETVAFSNGSSGMNGYRVPANNMLSCYVPFKLKDWQENDNKNRILKVDWTARMSVVKNTKFKPSEKTGSNWIYIGERELFNLE